MKNLHSILSVCLVVFLAMVLIVIAGGESQYASDNGIGGTAAVAITLGPGPGETVIKAIYAESDLEGAAVAISSRTGSPKAPTAIPTNGQVVISVDNSDGQFVYGDTVVYSHANGTQQYNSLWGVTTTTISLTNGLTVAGAAGDVVYEVTQTFEIEVGGHGTGVGTNDTMTTTGTVFISPKDSPVYVALTGTSNAVLAVTALK